MLWAAVAEAAAMAANKPLHWRKRDFFDGHAVPCFVRARCDFSSILAFLARYSNANVTKLLSLYSATKCARNRIINQFYRIDIVENIGDYNFLGLAIGVCTFLVIGVFHPIVVKSEYYFGTRCWWAFLFAGIGMGVGTLLVENIFVSALLGVTAFSCFWSIKEIFEQQERVKKGWFPRNPKRRYPWDSD